METAARYRDEDFERARTACIKHADDLLRRPNLYCVSVGFKIVDGKVREDELCVSVYVQAKRDAEQLEKDEVLPKELPASDGTMVPVDVVPMIRPVAQHVQQQLRLDDGGILAVITPRLGEELDDALARPVGQVLQAGGPCRPDVSRQSSHSDGKDPREHEARDERRFHGVGSCHACHAPAISLHLERGAANAVL